VPVLTIYKTMTSCIPIILSAFFSEVKDIRIENKLVNLLSGGIM